MNDSPVELVRALPAVARSVPEARAVLREAVAALGRDDLLDRAQLAVSELVTNALLHAGTDIELRVLGRLGSLRVEVHDGCRQAPVPRSHSATAGTGRGLHLVQECVDRWDVTTRADGKVVWFEMGDPWSRPGTSHPAPAPPAPEPVHEVRLLQVPLLMHWAWQEHASALLREYLLARLDEDDAVMEDHAEASEALSLLHDQVPAPRLPLDPGALMVESVGPAVTAEEVLLHVPARAVAHFETLDQMIRSAIRMAEAGTMLGPPTQPEVMAMRAWLCHQVSSQIGRGEPPVPWDVDDAATPPRPRPHAADAPLQLPVTALAMIVSNEANVIVGVTAAALRLLGYTDETQLLGHRVIAVVPPRFRQAHIAGTTLHMTNGRDALLGIPVTVPVLCADGSEIQAELTVESKLLGGDERFFVATLNRAA